MRKAWLTSVVLPPPLMIKVLAEIYASTLSVIPRFLDILFASGHISQITPLTARLSLHLLCNLSTSDCSLASTGSDIIEAPKRLGEWSFYSSTNSACETGPTYSQGPSTFTARMLANQATSPKDRFRSCPPYEPHVHEALMRHCAFSF